MHFLGKRTSGIQDQSTRAGHGLGGESIAVWTRDEYVPSSLSRSASQRRPAVSSEQRLCASDECAGGWKVPWKNRRRPLFEGHWGCSSQCLERIIRKSLRRERGDFPVTMQDETPHRHRIPLGLVMLAQGWITQAQLRQALEAQRSSGEGRIGEWIVRESGVSPAQVTRALAIQWSCPVLPVDGFAPNAMALAMPRIFIEELGLLPLRVAGARVIYLAFNQRMDASAAFALEKMSDLKVESGLIDESQFEAARSRLLESRFIDVTRTTASDADVLASKIAAILDQTQPVDARIVRIHQRYWLRTWLESGACHGVGTLPVTGEDVTDTIFTLEPASSSRSL